jgi:hypothetical protein
MVNGYAREEQHDRSGFVQALIFGTSATCSRYFFFTHHSNLCYSMKEATRHALNRICSLCDWHRSLYQSDV